MKKNITTITSILLLLSQGIIAKVLPARRNVEKKAEGLLCLDISQETPSKWRLMHASHCSHASHASHYSMSVQIKTDSIRDVPREYEEYIISKLSEQHGCTSDNVIINSLFLSKGADILHQHDIDEVLFSDTTEYYLYLNYNIVGVEKEKSSYRSIAHAGAPYDYEFIIPFSLLRTKYFYIRKPQTIFEKREFPSWMIDLIKKMEEK